MKLKDYLEDNGVVLWQENSVNGPQQTKSLAMYDYVEGLDRVLGKMVWICDYRANEDPKKKPIRNIEPTPVVVTDAKETSKDIYYSPVYFRPVKNGKVSSKVIAPMDNTGFRCHTGESVNNSLYQSKLQRCICRMCSKREQKRIRNKNRWFTAAGKRST